MSCRHFDTSTKRLQSSWRAWAALNQQRKPRMRLQALLRPGASEQAVSAAESAIGVTFTHDLKGLYRLSNGAKSDQCFAGLRFMSLSELVTAWQGNFVTAQSLGSSRIGISSELSSVPQGAIRRCYMNSGWISFATDGGGNYLAVDTDPDVNGTYGQIISHGRDILMMHVLGSDMAGFLDAMTHLLRSPQFDHVDPIRSLAMSLGLKVKPQAQAARGRVKATSGVRCRASAGSCT